MPCSYRVQVHFGRFNKGWAYDKTFRCFGVFVFFFKSGNTGVGVMKIKLSVISVNAVLFYSQTEQGYCLIMIWHLMLWGCVLLRGWSSYVSCTNSLSFSCTLKFLCLFLSSSHSAWLCLLLPRYLGICTFLSCWL